MMHNILVLTTIYVARLFSIASAELAECSRMGFCATESGIYINCPSITHVDHAILQVEARNRNVVMMRNIWYTEHSLPSTNTRIINRKQATMQINEAIRKSYEIKMPSRCQVIQSLSAAHIASFTKSGINTNLSLNTKLIFLGRGLRGLGRRNCKFQKTKRDRRKYYAD